MPRAYAARSAWQSGAARPAQALAHLRAKRKASSSACRWVSVKSPSGLPPRLTSRLQKKTQILVSQPTPLVFIKKKIFTYT